MRELDPVRALWTYERTSERFLVRAIEQTVYRWYVTVDRTSDLTTMAWSLVLCKTAGRLMLTVNHLSLPSDLLH